MGQDPRPVMREAYNMFKDGGNPEKVLSIGIPRFYEDFVWGKWLCTNIFVWRYSLTSRDPTLLCSLLLHFGTGTRASTSMLLYMPASVMNPRYVQTSDQKMSLQSRVELLHFPLLQKKPDEAKRWILEACRSPYGERYGRNGTMDVLLAKWEAFE